MRTHQLEGRKREEQVGELQNVAGHKRGLTNWRGGRGKSGLVSFKTWHVANEDSLARGEKEGGGRSGLVSSEMWHVANEDSLARGEEEGGGRRGLASLEMR